jgi:hypothetical protein
MPPLRVPLPGVPVAVDAGEIPVPDLIESDD